MPEPSATTVPVVEFRVDVAKRPNEEKIVVTFSRRTSDGWVAHSRTAVRVDETRQVVLQGVVEAL